MLSALSFVFALALGSAALAAPVWGDHASQRSVAADTGLFSAPDAPRDGVRSLPARWDVTSAIRVNFRERLGLPEGYGAARRVPRLLVRFVGPETIGGQVAPHGPPFAHRPDAAPVWPRQPEFVNRRPARAFAEAEPVRRPFGPSLRDHDGAGDRRLAALGAVLTDDAAPVPRALPQVDPVKLLAGHAAPRGTGGYLRAEMPTAGRQITFALPPVPVRAAPDDPRAFILDIATENVLRVFNNPAVALAALHDALFAPLREPAAPPAGMMAALAAALPPAAIPTPLPPGGRTVTGGGGRTPPEPEVPPPSPVPLPAPLALLALALGVLATAARRRHTGAAAARVGLAVALIALLPFAPLPAAAQDVAPDPAYRDQRCTLLGPAVVSGWLNLLRAYAEDDWTDAAEGTRLSEALTGLYLHIGCDGQALNDTLDCVTAFAFAGASEVAVHESARRCMRESGMTMR
jgi:hypothetical protein